MRIQSRLIIENLFLHDKKLTTNFQVGAIHLNFCISDRMKQIKVYCSESSVHGLTYIVNRDLHFIEKVLWVLAVILSFVCCGLLIYKIGVKVQEDAMVIYSSDTAITVLDVTFESFWD